MGIKGIWESTSITLTFGDILFISWVFSFGLNKIKELANERLKKDEINLANNIIDDIKEKTQYINKISPKVKAIDVLSQIPLTPIFLLKAK